MQKILILLFFISVSFANAQCVDTTSSYGGNCSECIGLDFAPVCGCDGKNYRTECDAFNCARLLADSGTICDNVEFEFRPTLLTSFTSAVGKICVYVKYRGSVVIQIYNVYGRKMYEEILIAYYNNVFLPGNLDRGFVPEYLEIPETANLQKGVYIVAVTVDGQSKVKKILKN